MTRRSLQGILLVAVVTNKAATLTLVNIAHFKKQPRDVHSPLPLSAHCTSTNPHTLPPHHLNNLLLNCISYNLHTRIPQVH